MPARSKREATKMDDILRKVALYIEDVHCEGERQLDRPLRMIGAAAVIKNPWYGRGFVEDLKPEILKHAARLGEVLSSAVVQAAGGGDRVEAYGKAAVIGTGGDIEHGRALIHQLRFGNKYRNAVGAKSYLNFANTKGGPGAPIHIPLLHKHDDSKRSHFITVQMSVPDAPGPDELVIALGATTGPSPHHRIGDRFRDIEEIRAEELA
jgi:Amino acid synthesis